MGLNLQGSSLGVGGDRQLCCHRLQPLPRKALAVTDNLGFAKHEISRVLLESEKVPERVREFFLSRANVLMGGITEYPRDRSPSV